MGFRVINLGLRVKLHPEEAAREIREAVKAADSNIDAAADALGISHNTMHRYIDDLGLRQELEAMRAQATQEGWRRNRRKT